MKKTLLIILVLGLVAALAVALTACNLGDLANKLGGDEEADDSGNGGSDGGNEQSEQMKTADQVKNLLGDKYLVTVKVGGTATDSDGTTSGETTFVAASDGTYTVWQQDDAAALVKLDGQKVYYYTYDQDKDQYTSVYQYNDAYNPFVFVSQIFMTESSLSYDTKVSASFLGRACTKYTDHESYNVLTVSYSYDEEWYIDNETGACLKHSWTASGQYMGQGGNASANFECTKFETGAGVDTFIATQTRKIAVKEWDSAQFAQAGLRGTISAPQGGTLLSANLSDEGYSVAYLVSGAKAAAKQNVNNLISAFFAAGANLDYEGEIAASYNSESLYEAEDEGGYASIDFSGYTQAGGRVDVQAAYSEENQGWYVEIDVSNDAE